ncbi:hypothetical protein SLS58_006556 [Diplodia intermedia]|uniref:Reverse transcriptase n=1 Tax=Diplodia intermedia TaxID=856260 RepID=A0ABR3TNF9_9PEZI
MDTGDNRPRKQAIMDACGWDVRTWNRFVRIVREEAESLLSYSGTYWASEAIVPVTSWATVPPRIQKKVLDVVNEKLRTQADVTAPISLDVLDWRIGPAMYNLVKCKLPLFFRLLVGWRLTGEANRLKESQRQGTATQEHTQNAGLSESSRTLAFYDPVLDVTRERLA